MAFVKYFFLKKFLFLAYYKINKVLLLIFKYNCVKFANRLQTCITQIYNDKLR
jgi:hypothetical protein